jgi:hypothetical protein
LKEQNDIEGNEQDNVFSNNACLSQFEVFASDQPLNSPEMESKFGNITTQFNDNSPWISARKSSETGKSSGIGDNEPWELEDNGEEIITPVPTTSRFSAFNNDEFSITEKADSHINFFSDSFNPPIIAETNSNANKENDDGHFTKQISNEDIDQSFAKSVRFDDNVQKIRAPTPQKDILNESKSSTTSDSNEVEIDDITPSFETISDRITDHMETSFVNVDTTDVKVYISFLILINEVSILFSDGTST